MKNIKYIQPIIILLGLFMCNSCEEFVEVGQPNSRVVSDVVYQNEELAIAAVNGIYHQLFNYTGFASGGVNSITVLGGLSADE